MEGFRFTLFGLLFFVLANSVDPEAKKKFLSPLATCYLLLATTIAVWALLERVMPHYYWSQWNLISSETVFGYGWHNVAFVKQSASVIGGPNQLATYLMPAFFISVVRAAKFVAEKSSKNLFTYLLLAIIFNLAILLTFSRSAFIGFILTMFIAPLILSKDKLIKNYAISMSVVIFIVLLTVIFFKEGAWELVTHGRSQSEHALAIKSSLSEIYSRFRHPVLLLFGGGLGSAGPIALKYGDGIISESWYLQLILELGLAGLVLWLTFIYTTIKNLFTLKEFGLFFGLISVSIAAIFLHTFADNPALVYTLFIMIGLTISGGQKNEKNTN